MTQLLHPALIARVLTALVVLVGMLMAGVTAWRVLRGFDPNAHSEAQLHLERRSELVSTLVSAMLAASIVGLALTVAAADRLSDSIRGAMCAYGVFSSTDVGFVAIGASAASAFACVFWLALHRLDLGMERAELTRRKFTWLLALAPLIVFDNLATLRFATELDLGVVASCCASQLDEALPTVWGSASAAWWTTLPGFAVAVGLAVLALVACLLTARRATAGASLGAALLSLVALVCTLPVLLGVVAPHVYETPQHRCPFCLLHLDVYGIGWVLYAALFVGAASGLTLGWLALHARSDEDATRVARRMSGRLGRWGAGAWLVTIVLMCAPVVRYWIVTGRTL